MTIAEMSVAEYIGISALDDSRRPARRAVLVRRISDG
jgi:hypothetical protein